MQGSFLNCGCLVDVTTAVEDLTPALPFKGPRLWESRYVAY